MPRKKLLSYIPLQVLVYGDLIIEIYADDQLPNGRGMPGQYKRIETFNLALEILWDAKEDAKRGLRKQLFADIRIPTSISMTLGIWQLQDWLKNFLI